MITIRHVVDGSVRELAPDEVEFDALAFLPGVVWVDLVGDDPVVCTALAELVIDRWIVEDMLQTKTHPKAESRLDLLFLVVGGVDFHIDADRFELSTVEVDAVLRNTMLITHSPAPMEVTRVTVQRLEQDPIHGQTAAELLHLLLDTMVDEYEPFIDEFIPSRIDEIEDLLFSGSVHPAARREIHLRRRDVQRLQRVAAPQAAAVRRLAAMTRDVAGGQSHLFTDIADRLAYVAAQTEALRAQLDTAFEHYQSLVANSQNEVMKVLTMVSATLLPITVVAGIYGMNFEFMPELRARWGYPAVMTINVMIIATSLLLFRSKGWIGRRSRPDTKDRMLRLGVGRVLQTPAIGARAVSRRAGRLVRGRSKG